jgi:hypothetical protein
MEEVTGSIPVRSTNHFRHLAVPPSCEPGGIVVANCKTATVGAGTVAFRGNGKAVTGVIGEFVL